MPDTEHEDEDERQEKTASGTRAPSAQKTHPEPVEETDEETGEAADAHDDYDEEQRAKREAEHKGTSRPEEAY